MDQKNKLARIYEGWKNTIFKTPQIELMAKNRANICSSCPHPIMSSFNVFQGKREVEKTGLVCGKCKCPIHMKTRSPHDHCPIGKW